jgi:hypothetical protein
MYILDPILTAYDQADPGKTPRRKTTLGYRPIMIEQGVPPALSDSVSSRLQKHVDKTRKAYRYL